MTNAKRIQAAAQRVTANDHEDALDEIKSADIRSCIEDLANTGIVEIATIQPEGYNQEGTGIAGAEIHFTGKVSSSVAYGSKALDRKSLNALTAWVNKTCDKVDEGEIELVIGEEENEFVLTLLGKPD